LLPDDLGTGDDAFQDDLTGGDFGSSLLDDLAGDPTDGTGGGGGMSDIDDQAGWAADLPTFPSLGGTPTPPPPPTDEELLESLDEPTSEELLESVDDIAADPEVTPEDGEADKDSGSGTDEDERETQEVTGDDDDDDDDEGQGRTSQGGDGPPKSQSMPAPDDGTGGQPDESDFIGGPGNVDPASETQPAGGAGELVGGRGDVDPAPETEDDGGGGALDMERAGFGAIDPFDGKSSLLGEDTGDLAEMDAEAEQGDIEIEIDDSLADVGIGDDV
jgi:hypothetical protein